MTDCQSSGEDPSRFSAVSERASRPFLLFTSAVCPGREPPAGGWGSWPGASVLLVCAVFDTWMTRILPRTPRDPGIVVSFPAGNTGFAYAVCGFYANTSLITGPGMGKFP